MSLTWPPRLCRLSVATCLTLAAGSAAGANPESSVTVRELDPKTGAALGKEDDLSLTYLSIGPLVALVGGAGSTVAGGLEAALMRYPSTQLPGLGVGAFTQAELYAGKYFRGALGVQAVAGVAGIELGLGARQGDGTYASTVSLHAGAFLSVGVLFFSLRLSPAIFAVPSNEPSYGFETAFTLGLKLPIVVHGRDPTGFAIQAGGRSW
jgi:hypothetical protein